MLIHQQNSHTCRGHCSFPAGQTMRNATSLSDSALSISQVRPWSILEGQLHLRKNIVKPHILIKERSRIKGIYKSY